MFYGQCNASAVVQSNKGAAQLQNLAPDQISSRGSK